MPFGLPMTVALLTGLVVSLLPVRASAQTTGPASELVVFETLSSETGADAPQAGVFAGTMTTQTVLFAMVSASRAADVGIAIVNPGSTAANVTLTLRLGADGTVMSTKTIVVGEHHQMSGFISQLFAYPTQLPLDFDGSLAITSDNPVAVIGLRFLGTRFSTIPITSLSSLSPVPEVGPGVGGTGAVILPQFASGGGWSSEIVLINTTSKSMTVRIDLFKQDGTPLTTSFNRQSQSSFQNIVIPAEGVLLESNAPAETLQIGYVVVTPVHATTAPSGIASAGTAIATQSGPIGITTGAGIAAPTVISVSPGNGATGVAPNAVLSATFSQPMNPLRITPAQFTVSGPGGSAVAGTVVYDGVSQSATFTPARNLALGTTFTATVSIGAMDLAGNAQTSNTVWSFATQPPQISLEASVSLAGSFVSSQAVYADAERIYLCSYQGDLFVLQRDRKSHFPLIQTISFESPLRAVSGDANYIYIANSNGSLDIYIKTWPLQFVRSVSLSSDGLSAVQVVGKNIYVAKGQSAMTATGSRLYLSEINPGDFAINVGSMNSYGDQRFITGTTLVFDSQTGQQIGTLPNPPEGGVNISAWGPSIYLTVPGCCGSEIQIYDAASLSPVQRLNRSTNVVAGVENGGAPLLVGGSESGNVDLYVLGQAGYEISYSLDLPATTGFTHSEDIEIRALWVDGIDNLVFAASSGGNDQSRARGGLPTFFVLNIQ